MARWDAVTEGPLLVRLSDTVPLVDDNERCQAQARWSDVPAPGQGARVFSVLPDFTRSRHKGATLMSQARQVITLNPFF